MSSRVDSIKARVDQKELRDRDLSSLKKGKCLYIRGFSKSQERDRVEAPHRRRKVEHSAGDTCLT